MNNTFSMRRFAMLWRWAWSTYKKILIGSVVGAAIVLFVFLEVSMLDIAGDRHEAGLVGKEISMYTNFILMFTLWGSVWGASLVWLMMGDRRQAMAFLLLPASPLEKFLFCHLVATLGLVLPVVCGALLADGLRLLVCLMAGPHVYVSMLEIAADKIALFFSSEYLLGFADEDGGWPCVACLVLLYLLVLSLFLLGGVFFRYKAWVVTPMLLLAVGFLYNASGISFFEDMLYTAKHSRTAATVIAACLLAVVIALYRLAYSLYCRYQLVGRKWICV